MGEGDAGVLVHLLDHLARAVHVLPVRQADGGLHHLAAKGSEGVFGLLLALPLQPAHEPLDVARRRGVRHQTPVGVEEERLTGLLELKEPLRNRLPVAILDAHAATPRATWIAPLGQTSTHFMHAVHTWSRTPRTMKWLGSVSWYFLGATLVPRPSTRVGQASRHLRQVSGSGHLSSSTRIVGSIKRPSDPPLA